ncbi:hypothetical protein EDB92DRAFT_1837924 [Lactarius akahatsu]|uniref:Uncharacterized protein n=1 Tax=Lactarius akahatsu TaxID=416441 RepID=A0AAD4LPX5_9AGAM|nr:hypothetical protein EDB92DRAFT_1837924 [Lactarius akahatsu]
MSSTTRYPSQPPEDWDHLDSPMTDSPTTVSNAPSRVAFPSRGAADDTLMPGAPPHGGRAGKRTLSELLKLHAEKGTDVHFSAEEAARVEEVLGQWVRVLRSPTPTTMIRLMPVVGEDKLRPVAVRRRGRRLFHAVAGRRDCALPSPVHVPLDPRRPPATRLRPRPE